MAASLQVLEGTGGMQSLGDDDKAEIEQTIDEDVLKRQEITFRSTAVEPDGDGGLHVQGDLTLLGPTPSARVRCRGRRRRRGQRRRRVKQTDWGMKPYSDALRGAEGRGRGRGQPRRRLPPQSL